MVEKRTIGLNFVNEEQANLSVWAPLADSVEIVTSGFTSALVKKELGFWEIFNISIRSGDLYSININGRTFPDPASLYQPEGVTGKSQAYNLSSYSWNDKGWHGIDVEDIIIYELHTGTFTDEGTFKGIVGKLTYLKELGINAIEIMPVAQFPGSRNWGYDGVFPFAVQNSYGGPMALQHLVDSCHQNGIAVILDVVLNHLGPEGNWLPEFGPFFTQKYKTPWGQAINFDDAWCDGVRSFFLENVLMWLRDFHIDGLRLDAIHAIKDFGPKNILQEIQQKVLILNRKTTMNHFLIGESDLNDVKYIMPFTEGGYGLDATWCDEFHHALHGFITEEKEGYYSDFGEMRQLVKTYNEGFVYDGIWSEHRKKIFGTGTSGFAGNKFVVFSQNHDQVGNRMMGDRLSSMLPFEMLKVVAGAMLFAPFIPLLFMGEEYGEKNPFQYFTSHNDPELIRLVREGRKKEFEAFIADNDPPDPQSEGTYNASKLFWKRSLHQKQLFGFYKELIRLRKTMPIWKSTDRSLFSAKSIRGNKVLQLTRKDKDQILLAILNFDTAPVPVITCDTHIKWEMLLNSNDKKWGGPGEYIDIRNPSVTIPPHTLIVLFSA